MSLHNDFPKHTGFQVAGEQARIFEITSFGKMPDDLFRLARFEPYDVWVTVLHVRKCFHHVGMFRNFVGTAEKELMVELVSVCHNEPDLLAQSHFDKCGVKDQFAAGLPRTFNMFTISQISQRRSVTPAAIAGVTRSVLMDTDEIAMHGVQCDRVSVVLDLF